MTTLTDDRRTQAPLEDEQVRGLDWIPVRDWDEKARGLKGLDEAPSEIIDDIEQIQRVISRMRGGPHLETGFKEAMHMLDIALNSRRMMLAKIILAMHGDENVGPLS